MINIPVRNAFSQVYIKVKNSFLTESLKFDFYVIHPRNVNENIVIHQKDLRRITFVQL